MQREEFAIKFAEWLQENRWYTYHPDTKKWHYTFEHGTAIAKKTYDKNYKKGTYQLLLNFMSEYDLEPTKTFSQIEQTYGFTEEELIEVVAYAKEYMKAKEENRIIPEGVNPVDPNSLFTKKNVLYFLEFKRKISYFHENGNAISNEEVFDMYEKAIKDDTIKTMFEGPNKR